MSILRRFGGPTSAQPSMGPIVDWSEKSLRARQPGIYRLDTTGSRTLPVVVESRHQERLAIAAGGRTADGAIERSHLAALKLEPDGHHGGTPVSVWIGRAGTVGYLGTEDARAYLPVISLLAERGLLVGCEATLTGGWDRDPFGVRLEAATPAELIASFWLGDVNPLVPKHPWVGKTVSFIGVSFHHLRGVRLDDPARQLLAVRAGCKTWPRITRQVDVCVVGSVPAASVDLQKAEQYEVDLVREPEFWYGVGFQLPLV